MPCPCSISSSVPLRDHHNQHVPCATMQKARSQPGWNPSAATRQQLRPPLFGTPWEEALPAHVAALAALVEGKAGEAYAQLITSVQPFIKARPSSSCHPCCSSSCAMPQGYTACMFPCRLCSPQNAADLTQACVNSAGIQGRPGCVAHRPHALRGAQPACSGLPRGRRGQSDREEVRRAGELRHAAAEVLRSGHAGHGCARCCAVQYPYHAC